MSVDDAFRQINMNAIRGVFLVASIIFIVAIIQKVKPAISITYQHNSNPSYIKAKLISKFLTVASLFAGGLYLYYFTDLTKPSNSSLYFLGFGYILYHASKWGLTKIIDSNKDKQDQSL